MGRRTFAGDGCRYLNLSNHGRAKFSALECQYGHMSRQTMCAPSPRQLTSTGKAGRLVSFRHDAANTKRVGICAGDWVAGSIPFLWTFWSPRSSRRQPYPLTYAGLPVIHVCGRRQFTKAGDTSAFDKPARLSRRLRLRINVRLDVDAVAKTEIVSAVENHVANPRVTAEIVDRRRR